MISSEKIRETRGVFGNFGREFREFVARGNAVDLAVGVSIGTAFSSLIQSFVQNIVAPPLRAAGNVLSGAAQSATGVVRANGFDWTPPQNGPGAFLGQLGSFAMLAFSTFVVVKIVNRVKRALEQRAMLSPADAPPNPEHEDAPTRLIAQNDRIIHLLEQLNAKAALPQSND